MIRPAVGVFLVALLAPGAFAADLSAARRASAEGRFAEAAEAYRAALEEDPGNPEARLGLAQVLSWDGRFAEAVEAYEAGLQRAPEDPALLLGLARTRSWASQFTESMAAYESYLAARPGDQAVRLEVAKVRSWAGEFEPAVEVYRDHLRRQPGDDPVRRELAKVLSWWERYDESIEEFTRVLAGDPGDREARLGLARTLSWSGRYRQAAEEYRRLLEADPSDAGARVGLARTLAWSGDLAGAAEQFDAILARRPEDAEALLGRAQVAWWRGEARASERYLARAEAASPGDADAVALRAEMRRSRRPVLDATYDRVLDTDGNDYKVARVMATFPLAAQVAVAGIYGHSEAYLDRVQANACLAPAEQAGDTATVDTLAARLSWALPRGVGLLATAGLERASPSVGEATTRGTGAVSAFGALRASWRWRAVLDHRTFDATRVIVDCGITTTALSGGLDGEWRGFRAGLGAGLAEFSDGNRRVHLDLFGSRPFAVGGHTLEPGLRLRVHAFDENLHNGYFDPQSFRAALATLRARGPMGSPRVEYTVRLEIGLQSFETHPNPDLGLEGFSQSNDTVLGWELRIGWEITRQARLEAYYGENDYALQSATGFQSEQSGLLFRYRF